MCMLIKSEMTMIKLGKIFNAHVRKGALMT